jgi:hypothetical protein
MTATSGRQPFATPESQAESEQRLTPEQLLALQLAARGYSMAQISPLVEQAPEAIPMLLEFATAALGRRTLVGAIFEARRRGLIV